MNPRKKIYLDLRFWILLRDFGNNSAANVDASRLLATLKSGVADGKIICPLSESIFLELLKQNDPESRRRSAILMDELSLGVTIEHYFCRMKYEIADLFTKYGDMETNLVPNHQLLWTKVPYVLGETHPSKTAFDKETELVIQKSFFDHMWRISLSEMVEQLDSTEIPDLALSEIATSLDDGKIANAHELTSFKQAYTAEAQGMADFAAAFGVEAVRDAATLAGFNTDNIQNEQDEESLLYCRNIIAHVLVKNKARIDLKTLHILACLLASHRWNRDQKFDGNDLYDFDHASAAIGYCDVFLTEKPLKTMLEQKHHNLNNDFSCVIFSEIDAAIAHISSINQN